jgi:hypothetical protein
VTKPASKEHLLRLSMLGRFEGWFIPEPNSGCWLWTGHGLPWGYGSFALGVPRGESVLAHRASYHFYVGPIPDGLLILHRCDVPACVNPDHLFPGTEADNAHDMILKGRGHPAPLHQGSGHWNVALTEEIVREIRSTADSARSLAERLGVTPWTIYDIRSRRSWRHV